MSFINLGDVIEITPKIPKLSPDTEVSFLAMSDISKEGIITNNYRRKYSEVSKGYSGFCESDVLVAKITPCFENGKGALATGLINGVGFGSTEFYILRSSDKIIPYILLHITQNKYFRLKGKSQMTGSAGHKRIPQSFIENYKIFLPPLPEQQKIANILRAWDESIKILTKLCEIKQQIYKAVAKDIFDNQAKGEKWQTVKLSGISTIRKGKQLNRLDMKGGLYPVWNGGVIPSGFTDEWNMEANIITISGGGNSCGFVNLCKERFWLSSCCYAITKLSSNINQYFLFFQLKKIEQKIMKLRVGTGLPSISKPSIENYLVYIPSIERQNQIANYLNSLRDELETYKKELELIKKQKQGLIQKLLTGEWRVQVDK
ncbi:MAG TPA: restriction endonuclease subunit S [Rickettsia endosymbiont of Pyrocoelia pectoralis]|nr:restriction endonuclease subunit S [Rickettsia endosymbiont of Pyrocoelia pectoralis]